MSAPVNLAATFYLANFAESFSRKSTEKRVFSRTFGRMESDRDGSLTGGTDGMGSDLNAETKETTKVAASSILHSQKVYEKPPVRP